ncbi:PTS sugar transporter subunit IIB [candidate division KSB1 bacterium]|nr:PTS sugar transporter subunit IIB [candidate division KSB1 bacterium]
MPLEMIRIDDRLIHGQVVVGWCPILKPDRLILCDDEVAQSDWEAEIYKDAAADYQTSIYTVAEAAAALRSEQFKNEKLFLIVGSPEVIVRLTELGLKINKVVVGGMHHQPGKRKILDFVYIDDRDLEYFRLLTERQVSLEAKDVPTCKSFDLAKKLGLN